MKTITAWNIGLLIDAAAARARILEMNIGRIEHESHPLAMRHVSGCREHRLCKLNVLRHLLDELGITAEQVLMVGDSGNDVCLLRAAGISVAFQPKTPAVRDAARYVVRDDLRGALRLLGEPVSKQPEI